LLHPPSLPSHNQQQGPNVQQGSEAPKSWLQQHAHLPRHPSQQQQAQGQVEQAGNGQQGEGHVEVCSNASKVMGSTSHTSIPAYPHSRSIEGSRLNSEYHNGGKSSDSSDVTPSHAHNLSAAALQSLIMACNSLQELGLIHTEHAPNMDIIHVSSMLTKV
jgi:hypothetical protein